MTITAKELYDATLAGEGILAKHAKENPGMPVFLLIGQDQHASELVEKWSIWAGAGVPECGAPEAAHKVQEAREIAEHMRRWPVHKNPD